MMESKNGDLYGSDGEKIEMGGLLAKHEELCQLAADAIGADLTTGAIFVLKSMVEVSCILKGLPNNDFRTKFLDLIMETHRLTVEDMKKAKEKHN